MPKISPDRMAAQIEGDFVVFLIGMRIKKFWKITKWWPAFMAMPRMLKELERRPSAETGFLGYTTLGFGNIVQYWRSFEHLEAYANSREGEHFPAWAAFNKLLKTHAVMWAFGTKAMPSKRANTRRSIWRCRRRVWARQPA